MAATGSINVQAAPRRNCSAQVGAHGIRKTCYKSRGVPCSRNRSRCKPLDEGVDDAPGVSSATSGRSQYEVSDLPLANTCSLRGTSAAHGAQTHVDAASSAAPSSERKTQSLSPEEIQRRSVMCYLHLQTVNGMRRWPRSRRCKSGQGVYIYIFIYIYVYI